MIILSQCIQAQADLHEWKQRFEDIEQKYLHEQKSTAMVQKVGFDALVQHSCPLKVAVHYNLYCIVF